MLDDEGDGAATLRNAVTRCVAEVRDLGRSAEGAERGAVVAGIGTTAPHALGGALLSQALTAAGVELARTLPFPEPSALLGDSSWDLALVLSPWKQAVAGELARATESAARTGVVDTIVRRAGEPVGVNTNAWAAQAAMETVLGGRTPGTVLILGSGGSSNSVALGCRRAWPGTRLVGSARNAPALTAWAARFAAEAVAPTDLGEFFGAGRPPLIVNTTTWGETDASESEPFGFDFEELLAPGNCYFDLNNRVSALQHAALRGGMNVISGTFMQRVTNACRAALLTTRTP
ncbi:hypothetical protein [Nocardia sp. BMG51109]|uniref:hypothetical protein n=1 Tax=Nocardia sp. BMG51109 TaxID=1056816 RepID=UPI00046395EF|nr:hypothetical protein [Nocardia sp. BMG51109]